MIKKINWIAFLCLCAAALTACIHQEGEDAHAPNEVVLEYFDALYNKKDFQKLTELSSHYNIRILEQYGTAAALSRYVYNMSFERVDITVEGMTVLGQVENPDKTRVRVMLTGFNQGKRIDEICEVQVIFEDEAWRVDKVFPKIY